MKNLAYKRTINGDYNRVYSRVENALNIVGFGIITQVAMHEKIKAKLNKNIPIYQILGVCSPKHAYEALKIEENIGLFLPCKVLIKEKGENEFEVVAINSKEMMGMLNNEELMPIATEVNNSLYAFIESL